MAAADLGRVDVLVIGAGNAAANAALQAREMGASVAMLETAPKEARGGNSAFTGGAFRFTFRAVEDLVALAPDIRDLDLANIDFGSYTAEQYYDDMHRLTEYRCDPELTDVLIGESYAAALWLKKQGIRFQPALGRQAFKVDGKFKFWGGLACHLLGGGAQLVKTLHEALERAGIKVLYDTTAVALIHAGGRVQGVHARQRGEDIQLRAKAVVLACGGFEFEPGDARPLPRAQLGPRQGARHSIQQWPGPSHGHRAWSRHPRSLVGRPRRAMGHECAALRRPHHRRPFPEAQLSVRHHRQRPRAAIRRRGRGLPQLHLRQVRA